MVEEAGVHFIKLGTILDQRGQIRVHITRLHGGGSMVMLLAHAVHHRIMQGHPLFKVIGGLQLQISSIAFQCRPVVRLSFHGNLVAAESSLHLAAGRQEIGHCHELVCRTGLEALLVQTLGQMQIPPLGLTPECLVQAVLPVNGITTVPGVANAHGIRAVAGFAHGGSRQTRCQGTEGCIVRKSTTDAANLAVCPAGREVHILPDGGQVLSREYRITGHIAQAVGKLSFGAQILFHRQADVITMPGQVSRAAPVAGAIARLLATGHKAGFPILQLVKIRIKFSLLPTIIIVVETVNHIILAPALASKLHRRGGCYAACHGHFEFLCANLAVKRFKIAQRLLHILGGAGMEHIRHPVQVRTEVCHQLFPLRASCDRAYCLRPRLANQRDACKIQSIPRLLHKFQDGGIIQLAKLADDTVCQREIYFLRVSPIICLELIVREILRLLLFQLISQAAHLPQGRRELSLHAGFRHYVLAGIQGHIILVEGFIILATNAAIRCCIFRFLLPGRVIIVHNLIVVAPVIDLGITNNASIDILHLGHLLLHLGRE